MKIPDSLDNRTIDQLVAEHVLKLTVKKIRVDWYQFEIWLFLDPDGLIRYSWDGNACNAIMNRNGRDESDGVADPLPFFSIETESAWEVVEAMKNDRHFRDRLYTADFLNLSSEQAARAICVASLESV